MDLLQQHNFQVSSFRDLAGSRHLRLLFIYGPTLGLVTVFKTLDLKKLLFLPRRSTPETEALGSETRA